MKKKILISSMILATFLAFSTIVSAQYEDMVIDDEGNVIRIVGEDQDDWILVESPNLDITQIRLSETDEIVTVSLTVEGTITDDSDIFYRIILKDDVQGTFDIAYSNGKSKITAVTGRFWNMFEPEATGVGTNTLNIFFSREQIGDPDVLLISQVIAENKGTGDVNLAGPDAEYPPGYEDTPQEPVDDPNDVLPEDPSDDTEEVNGTPGLGLMSLILGLVFVVGAYYKKNR